MSTLSTHVLDTSAGTPAANVPVKLEKKIEMGVWKMVGEFKTNSDGRIQDFSARNKQIATGVYRLTFDTSTYFATKQTNGFYPYVSIVFEISQENQHYHVPLLLSGWGYSTYRGS